MQTLKIKKRKILGRKVKTLRNDGVLPANVYGKKIKSVSVKVNQKEFEKVFEKAGETGIVELVEGKTKKPVLIHNVQIDPVTDELLHVDFLQVDLKAKVVATVPIELKGESPADKSGLGILVKQLDEVEVEALPADLPEKLFVDISKLEEVDQAVYLKDIRVDKAKVEIKEDLEKIVAKIEPQTKEEEDVPPPPTEGEEKVVEGEEGEKVEGEEAKEQEGEEQKEEGKQEKTPEAKE